MSYAFDISLMLCLSYDNEFTYPEMIIKIGIAIPIQKGNKYLNLSLSVHEK
jgi:hypothetical protein